LFEVWRATKLTKQSFWGLKKEITKTPYKAIQDLKNRYGNYVNMYYLYFYLSLRKRSSTAAPEFASRRMHLLQ